RTFDAATGRETARAITGTTPVVRNESYGYDGYGRLQTVNASVGATTLSSTYTYNPRDRLTAEIHNVNGVLLGSYTYGYDGPTGLRTSKARTTAAGTTTTTYG